MTKTTFELEFETRTLDSAKDLAHAMISDFLELPTSEDASKVVDLEFKVRNTKDFELYAVTVYASVKRT
jgi:hypothetical protein